MDETIRQLVEKNMESIVSIRVVKKLPSVQGGGGREQLRAGKEEEKEKTGGSTSGVRGGGREEHLAGKEEEKEKTSCTDEMESLTAVYYATGSIIHCCDLLALLISCAHTFQPTRVPAAQPGEPEIDTDTTNIMVDFFDGHTAVGFLMDIDWLQDLSLLMVRMGGAGARKYRAVKFIEHACAARGFIVYDRETPLYSISTFPAEQRRALFGTVQAGKICGPPRLGREIDAALDPDLKMFQFQMDGADGCSGGPIFTQTRQVMGVWISHVGDFKFGVLVHSVCDWLRRSFNIQETSMKLVVDNLVSLFTRNLMLADR